MIKTLGKKIPAINATALRIMPSARTPGRNSSSVYKYTGINNTQATINVNNVNITCLASLKFSGNPIVIKPKMVHPMIRSELYINDNTSMAV